MRHFHYADAKVNGNAVFRELLLKVRKFRRCVRIVQIFSISRCFVVACYPSLMILEVNSELEQQKKKNNAPSKRGVLISSHNFASDIQPEELNYLRGKPPQRSKQSPTDKQN